MHQLPGFGVLLKPGGIGARLMIEQHYLGAPADFGEVAERPALCADRPAVHPNPQALGSARGFRDAVIQVPHFEAALVIPLDPLPVNRAAPILRARQGLARLIAKLAGAVFAVTDAVAPEAAPAIVGEA